MIDETDIHNHKYLKKYYKALKPDQDESMSDQTTFQRAMVQAHHWVIDEGVEYALIIPAESKLEEVFPLMIDKTYIEGGF